MSTSVTARKLSERHKLLLLDLGATLFAALFGAVYEAFSHGVYSYCMIYAFAFPLVLGVLPLILIGILRAPYPNRVIRSMQHAGIATLTVGSIVSGVLFIYGTTSPLTCAYWIAGGILTALGAAVYLISLSKNRPEITAQRDCRPGK